VEASGGNIELDDTPGIWDHVSVFNGVRGPPLLKSMFWAVDLRTDSGTAL
jgi:hypothetical protein